MLSSQVDSCISAVSRFSFRILGLSLMVVLMSSSFLASSFCSSSI